MRVLLISANTETMNMVPLPLGLNLVAVATREAGHEVEIVDLMGTSDNESSIREAVRRTNPEAIGISVRNIDNQHMGERKFLLEPVREAVEACRRHSRAPIIIGGAGFSIFPEAVLGYLHADMGICGEGEIAFPQLLAALEKGEGLANIAGLCLPRKPVQEGPALRAPLDRLPLPSASFWRVPPLNDQEIWIPFQTRRGCPMKCSYCSTPALEGTAIRNQPVERVVAALSEHTEAGYDRFYFVDNTFNFPPDYAKALCDAIVEKGLDIKWRAIVYPARLDEELVQKMAAAGCVEVSLGFESGCEDILQGLNKKYTPADVRESSRLLARHGIRRMGFLLLGAPGETRETVLESLAFADSLDLDLLKVSIGIRIYPDTELARIAVEEGVVAPNDDLLLPRFYLAPGLDGWVHETVRQWLAERPYAMM